VKQLNVDNPGLSGIIRPGDQVLWGEGPGEPVSLVNALSTQLDRLEAVRFFVGFGSTLPREASAFGAKRVTSYGAIGTTRRLAAAGGLDIVPCHIGLLPHYIADGTIPCDVALVHVSAPGPDGRFSLGASVMHMEAAIGRARVVVAEVNELMPWTYGGQGLTCDQIDFYVETSTALPEHPPSTLSPADIAIARNAATYVGDGATLQIGIGAVPDALLQLLGDRRDLGIHSGMISDRVGDLIRSGVVTNSRKPIDTGTSVAGILVGTSRLYELARENVCLQVRPSSYTHSPATLAQIPGFVSINSALEVDLTGQVNAEAIEGRFIGATGGQAEFLRAAHRSPGGRAIVALPATSGGRSRIVARLSGPVSTPRSDIDVVVTEFGVAELRGRSLAERRRALIAIADPIHRDALEECTGDPE